MVATDTKNIDPKRDTELMTVERDTLSMWLKTSKIPDGVSRFDVLHELENREGSKAENGVSGITDDSNETESGDVASMMNEWASFFEDNGLDIVLATSSLTEGSDFFFDNIDDARDDGIDSVCTSEEEKGDNNKNDKGANREKIRLERKERVRSGTRVSSIKRLPPAQRDTVSYAQLFFDPETKSLVTLMEVAKNTASGAIRSDNFSKCHQCHLRRKDAFNRRGTPLHRSSLLLQNNDASFELSRRDGRTPNDENIPFLDKTILTECSSISSAASEEEDGGGGDHWAFLGAGSNHDLPWEDTAPRYPEEPIVFSNDESMGDHRMCWLEEAEIDLYLLHDCDDVWDYGTANNSRCTDSLKKLLMASRLCISLPHIGELKWKASTGNHNASGDFSSGNNGKIKLERPSYATLADN
eukprot:jgi/Psemu1/2112/gm1.2112_g